MRKISKIEYVIDLWKRDKLSDREAMNEIALLTKGIHSGGFISSNDYYSDNTFPSARKPRRE